MAAISRRSKTSGEKQSEMPRVEVPLGRVPDWRNLWPCATRSLRISTFGITARTLGTSMDFQTLSAVIHDQRRSGLDYETFAFQLPLRLEIDQMYQRSTCALGCMCSQTERET